MLDLILVTRKLSLALVFAVTAPSLVMAQSLNVNFSAFGANPSYNPSDSYAAEGEAGAWNWIQWSTAEPSKSLVGLDYGATAVVLTHDLRGQSTFGDNVTDEEKLFRTALGNYEIPYNVEFSGLAACDYELYVYSFSGSFGTGTIYVTDAIGTQTIAAFGPGYQHASTSVSVDASGSLLLHSPYTAARLHGLAGLQLVMACADADSDGVVDTYDLCLGTELPDEPTVALKGARFAALPNGAFVSGLDQFDGMYTIDDTAGCSGTQIIELLGLGAGHTKFGISKSALETFIESVGD